MTDIFQPTQPPALPQEQTPAPETTRKKRGGRRGPRAAKVEARKPGRPRKPQTDKHVVEAPARQQNMIAIDLLSGMSPSSLAFFVKYLNDFGALSKADQSAVSNALAQFFA